MRSFVRRLTMIALVLAAVPAAATASQTYPEHTGDAPGGAPDVSGITVSHTQAGAVTFRLRLANRTTLVGDDVVAILLDSHQGAPDGEIEYGIVLMGDVPLAAVVDVNTEAILGAVPITVGDGLTVTVPKTVIGNPAADFDFGVISYTGDEATEAETEVVPHTGAFRYSVVVAVTQVNARAVTAPKAGAVFRLAPVTVALTTDETVPAQSVVATARINGKLVKPLPGGTSWKIPKTARGKKLVVTVRGSHSGTSKTQVLSYRIK